MKKYPLGTRLLFFTHRVTGVGVHEIYELSVLRRLITWLDSLDGSPPI